MATLSDLRTVVRTQTETTSSELPDGTVDWYIRQAFDRTVAMENTWPSYEASWNVSTVSGPISVMASQSVIPIPEDCNRASINSLADYESGSRLNMIDHETAEGLYLNGFYTTQYAYEYSIWNGNFWLWPQAEWTAPKSYILRGHRLPADWVSQGDAAVVDADIRLHYPLAHYAIALAYAQQEATELEEVYMGRWQRDTQAARNAIMEPSRQQPMSFGGGKRRYRRFFRVNVNTPTI